MSTFAMGGFGKKKERYGDWRVGSVYGTQAGLKMGSITYFRLMLDRTISLARERSHAIIKMVSKGTVVLTLLASPFIGDLGEGTEVSIELYYIYNLRCG
jgi:hypothetical protein